MKPIDAVIMIAYFQRSRVTVASLWGAIGLVSCQVTNNRVWQVYWVSSTAEDEWGQFCDTLLEAKCLTVSPTVKYAVPHKMLFQLIVVWC